MHSILNTLSKENEKEINEFGHGFFLPPLDEESAATLAIVAQQALKQRLSEEYLTLIKITDGFSLDGFNLYSSSETNESFYLPGVIEANVAFWEEESLRNYIAYADENTSRLVFNLTQKKYECVDNITWETIEVFESFFEALAFILKESQIID